MNRTDIINAVIRTFGYESYLEIGVRNPWDNFELIECATKKGIDPATAHPLVERVKSAEFFGHCILSWDLIFLDGDHREATVQADTDDALLHLSERGCLVMHDCRPLTEAAVAAEKPPNGRAWNGQAWRVFLRLRGRRDLVAVCVDADHGVGLVWRNRGQIPYYQHLPSVDVQRGQEFATYFNERHRMLELVATKHLQTFLEMVCR